eukprot:CAMPEP_0178852284 /NCGR_PEP_ID=MMETSP0746-20121128/21581_1 /TAXON_ID=913974 /ORGANISM="Nitzschia punctata, Strain CCMP561" /LENGTH=107 /DNA_ID=CAMNT_0020517921 /DNA_START=38 /DNA_END=361 /DNA_ORIENTATION=-
MKFQVIPTIMTAVMERCPVNNHDRSNGTLSRLQLSSSTHSITEDEENGEANKNGNHHRQSAHSQPQESIPEGKMVHFGVAVEEDKDNEQATKNGKHGQPQEIHVPSS